MAVICEMCERTFNAEEALEQHRRDSPAHAIVYDCEEYDRNFDTEQEVKPRAVI